MLLADDFMDANGHKPVLAQMTERFEHECVSLLAVQNVPRADTRQYGIVSAQPFVDKLEMVSGIVEKPEPDAAPSTLAVVGRYVLTNRIFDHLERIGAGAGGEIQLTDAIAAMLKEERVLAYRYDGDRYDCGSKLGYLKATVVMGLRHGETGAGLSAFLRQLEGGK